MAPFRVQVSLFDTDPQAFEFDQERVVVGRAGDVDLQIAHAAVSRRHLTIERIATPDGGPARFRIIPERARNQTLVGGRSAIEGVLQPGELVAVGEVRLSVERVTPPARGKKPMRIAIGVAFLVVVMVLVSLRVPRAARLELDDPLFVADPLVSCENPAVCARRARTAFDHAIVYSGQGGVPGNWYRATLELRRAAQFQKLAGRAVDGLGTLPALLPRTEKEAITQYDDALFALARDLENRDPQALRATVRTLIAVVPDDSHPIRQKLERYLKEHPLPEKPL